MSKRTNRPESPDSSHKSILQEADAIAGSGAERARDYGHPLENHERIAAMWNVQLGPKLTAPIEPREVALMMVSLKLAREVNTPKRDNLLDGIGYFKCVDEIDKKQAQQKAELLEKQ